MDRYRAAAQHEPNRTGNRRLRSWAWTGIHHLATCGLAWLLGDVTDVETCLIEHALGVRSRHADDVRDDAHPLPAAHGERHLRAGGVLAAGGRILVEDRSLRCRRVEARLALFRLEPRLSQPLLRRLQIEADDVRHLEILADDP